MIIANSVLRASLASLFTYSSTDTPHSVLSLFNPLSPKSDQHQILPVISMLCKTEWLWKLWTWSHKMNVLVILSTSLHHISRKWIGEKMRIQILILGFKGLNKKVGDAPTPVHRSHLHQAILFIYRFFIYKFAKNSMRVKFTYYSGHSPGLFIKPKTPINRLRQEDNENVCSGKEAGRGWKYWKYDLKKHCILSCII